MCLEYGRIRLSVSQSDSLAAIDEGGTIYSPTDMFHYIQLGPHERRMVRDFKKRFGGTEVWNRDQ